MYMYICINIVLHVSQMAKWCKLDQCKMTIMEALMKLDQIIDESDPDVSSTPQLNNINFSSDYIVIIWNL